MHPFSYTGLKIIHDQEIRETLERKYPDTKRETQRPGLFQTLVTFLTHFEHQHNQKQEKALASCDWGAEYSAGQCCTATR